MRGLVKAKDIKLATLKFRSGRAGGLEAALRALNQGNVYMGISQEMKLTDGIHAQLGEGYAVWVSAAEIRHWGGVAVVWRKDVGWQEEGIVNFGPNVASLLLMLRSWRWYVVGVYVPPNDAPAIHCVEQALESDPKGMKAILLGELNAKLRELLEAREEDLATALEDSGLVDMKSHFIPRRRYRGTGI